jgi:signal transduction histidine kinase
LAIVKWSVERMGGTVELKSEVGCGSAFRLRLRPVSP